MPLPPDGIQQPAATSNSGIGHFLVHGLQNVLESFKGTQAVRVRQFQEQLERDKLTEAQKQHQANVDFQHSQLDEQKRQFDLTQKAANAIQEVQLAHTKQQIAAGVKGGTPIPGMTESPRVGDPNTSEGGFTPINPQQATTRNITLPNGMGSFTIPTDTEEAKSKAALERITGAPAEESKIRAEKAKQEEETKRQIQLKWEDLNKVQAQKQYDAERAAEAQKAHDAEIKYIQGQENYRAGLKLKSGKTDLSPYIKQAQDGELTQEGINKLPLPQEDKIGILSSVVGPGGRVLKDSDQQTIKDMATISTAVPHMHAALDLMQQHSKLGLNPTTQAGKDFQKEIQQIELVLPQVGRVIAGDKGRLSNQQIQYANGAFIPNKTMITGPDLKQNISNVNDFLHTMNDILDNHMIGMTPEHKAYLKKQLGVKDLTPYGLKLNNDNKATRPPLSSYTVNQ